MTIRAKVRLNTKIVTIANVPTGRDDNGRLVWGNAEVTTIVATPVVGSADPDSENNQFFASTPSGEVRLGVVPAAIAAQFELGKEYYIDFVPAS